MKAVVCLFLASLVSLVGAQCGGTGLPGSSLCANYLNFDNSAVALLADSQTLNTNIENAVTQIVTFVNNTNQQVTAAQRERCSNWIGGFICSTLYGKCDGNTIVRPCRDYCSEGSDACGAVPNWDTVWDTLVANNQGGSASIWRAIQEHQCTSPVFPVGSGSALFPSTSCLANADGSIRCPGGNTVASLGQCNVNPPVFVSNPTLGDRTTTSFTVRATPNESGRLYCIAQPFQVGGGTPSAAQIANNNNGGACGGNQNCQTLIGNLNPGTQYIVYCAAQNGLGSFTAVRSFQATTLGFGGDTIPPQWLIVSNNDNLEVFATTASTATVVALIDEAALLYCSARPTSTGQLTAGELINSASFALCGSDLRCDLTLGNLEPNRNYIITCAIQDASFNVQTATRSVQVQTQGFIDTAPPDFINGFPVIESKTPGSVTILAQLNENGKVWCLPTFPNTFFNAPALSTLKEDGIGYPCLARQDCRVRFGQLTAGTTYDIWCGSEDLSFNPSRNVVGFKNFRTPGDTFAPRWEATPYIADHTPTSVLITADTDEFGAITCFARAPNTARPGVETIRANGFTDACDPIRRCTVEVLNLNPSTSYTVYCLLDDVYQNTNNQVGEVFVVTDAATDNQAPAWLETPTMMGSTETTVIVDARFNEDGRMFCAVGTTQNPAVAQVRGSGFYSNCAAGVVCVVEVGNLRQARAYTVWCSIEDMNGNVQQQPRAVNTNTAAAPDRDAPVWTRPDLIVDANSRSFAVTSRVNERAVLYCRAVTSPVSQGNANPSPSSLAMSTSARTDCVNTADCSLTISGLSANRDYQIQCAIVDVAGNWNPEVKFASRSTDPNNNVAPQWVNLVNNAQNPDTVSLNQHEIQVRATMNENGYLGCLAMTPGSINNINNPAPNAQRIADDSNMVNCNGGQNCIVTIFGLAPGTQYSLFCAIWDADGNVNTNARTLTPVSTAALGNQEAPLWRRQPTMSTVNANSITIWGVPNKAGVSMWCLANLQTANQTPTRNQISNNGVRASCGMGFRPCSIQVGNLAANTLYDVSCTMTDDAGNRVGSPTHLRGIRTNNVDNVNPNFLMAPAFLQSHPTSVEIEAVADEASDFSCQALPNGAAQPTARVVSRDGEKMRCRARTPCHVSIANLDNNRDYDIYCTLEDLSSNFPNNGVTLLQVRTPVEIDNEPPHWQAGLSASSTGSSVTLTTQLSETGTMSCYISDPEDHPMRSAELTRMSGPRFAHSLLNCDGNSACSVTINGLTRNTEYKAECAIQDTSFNTNWAIRSTHIRTANTGNSVCGDGRVEAGEVCELGQRTMCRSLSDNLYNAGYAQCLRCNRWRTEECVRRPETPRHIGIGPGTAGTEEMGVQENMDTPEV